MHTILNCILVEAGARKVALIEGPSYMNPDGQREYQLRHTRYPEAFREWWKLRDWFIKDDNWNNEQYVKALDTFREKYGAEEDRLFEKQCREFLQKYYPSLHFTNGFIHKAPMSAKTLTYVGGPATGKLLGYPCWRNYGKEGYSVSLMATFKSFYPVQILGNTACSQKHIGTFLALARKYYTVLKKSPLGDDLSDVYVEVKN